LVHRALAVDDPPNIDEVDFSEHRRVSRNQLQNAASSCVMLVGTFARRALREPHERSPRSAAMRRDRKRLLRSASTDPATQ